MGSHLVEIGALEHPVPRCGTPLHGGDPSVRRPPAGRGHGPRGRRSPHRRCGPREVVSELQVPDLDVECAVSEIPTRPLVGARVFDAPPLMPRVVSGVRHRSEARTGERTDVRVQPPVWNTEMHSSPAGKLNTWPEARVVPWLLRPRTPVPPTKRCTDSGIGEPPGQDPPFSSGAHTPRPRAPLRAPVLRPMTDRPLIDGLGQESGGRRRTRGRGRACRRGPRRPGRRRGRGSPARGSGPRDARGTSGDPRPPRPGRDGAGSRRGRPGQSCPTAQLPSARRLASRCAAGRGRRRCCSRPGAAATTCLGSRRARVRTPGTPGPRTTRARAC